MIEESREGGWIVLRKRVALPMKFWKRLRFKRSRDLFGESRVFGPISDEHFYREFIEEPVKSESGVEIGPRRGA